MIGNNANEGPAFVPQNIETEADVVSWLRKTYPLLTDNDIAKVLRYYPGTDALSDPVRPLFATAGDSGPTALNQSTLATGQQQRANNIYAEATIVCPSYWLAEAYSDNAAGGQAYKYQFSVPPALHAYDVAAYFSKPGTMIYSAELVTAFQTMIGNFVVSGNPSISDKVADGASAIDRSSGNAASHWPPFSVEQPMQIDLNTTCQFSETSAQPLDGFDRGFFLDNKFCGAAGDRLDIRLVDAYTWEGGRGVRCDFWRSAGGLIPA
jgi:carboxylesterase type B